MESQKPDQRVIRKLRLLAMQGSSVRELVEAIENGIGRKPETVLPVLWYFVNAFHLPLATVLPIREWLGSTEDREIDAIILPEIRGSMQKWREEVPESVETAS